MLQKTRLFMDAIIKMQDKILVGEGVKFKRYRRISYSVLYRR